MRAFIETMIWQIYGFLKGINIAKEVVFSQIKSIQSVKTKSRSRF